MGQAKKRGSIEQRIEQAKARIEALKPSKITCNNCKGEIRDVQVMDVRGMLGVDAVFAGTCPACGQTTLAARGDSNAVTKFLSDFDSYMGSEGTMAVQPVIKNK